MKKYRQRVLRRRLRRIFLLFAVLVFAFAAFNPFMKMSRVTLSPEGLPDGFDGFRIALIADVHSLGGEDYSKLAASVAEEKPDIIVLAGDITDKSASDADAALALARSLAETAPVFFSSGNHERWGKNPFIPYKQLLEDYRAAGVTVLEDEGVILSRGGDEIYLLGLADAAVWGTDDGEEYYSELFASLELPDMFTAIINHRGSLFDAVARNSSGIVLSGHVHGGIIRIPFVGGLVNPDRTLFPKYDGGVYTVEDSAMVLSRGLVRGTIPRVFNRPEVVLVTLTKE